MFFKNSGRDADLQLTKGIRQSLYLERTMKIALIAPPYPLEEAPSPPLGLCYVAAACEKAGAEVRIFDYIVRKFSKTRLEEDIKRFMPDVIGTTAVTMNYKKAADIIKTVKTINPSIITMFGGPHVSFDIENTLTDYPEVDIVLQGEAEETLQELVPLLNDKTDWDTISGIAFRKKNGIVFTGPRPLMEDLDTLPLPSRHLLPMSRYQALGFPVSIITSRGCPNKCIFCLGRKMVGFKVRHRSTALVVDEIEDILSYGFEIINIADDLFTASKKRVREFCDEIERRNLTFKWSVFARVNTVDTDTLTVMKKAGCHSISFGIESGNPEMLKRVKKNITLDQARNAVKACKETGISAHASFMAGLPGETLQSLNDSENFSKELDIEYGYHFLAPFPGTTLREKNDEFDLEILTDDWDLYDADNVIVKTSALTPDDIKEFVDNASKQIREDWKELNRRYRQDNVTDAEHLQVAGFHRMVMIYKILSEDLIETNPASHDVFDSALLSLAEFVAEKTGLETEFAKFHINDLITKGYILSEKENGKLVFFWSHNNNTATFQ